MSERCGYSVRILGHLGSPIDEKILVSSPRGQGGDLAGRGDHGVMKAELGLKNLQTTRPDHG
jgi:hypothetical protein